MAKTKTNNIYISQQGVDIHIFGIFINYTDKKERHHSDYPYKFSFKCEDANCHKILILDHILLKLDRGVNEYLYFPHA